MTTTSTNAASAEVKATRADGGLTIAIAGRLDAGTTAEAWSRAVKPTEGSDLGGRLVVDVSDVAYCDGAGVGLLLELRCRAHDAGADFALQGASESLQRLLTLYPFEKFLEPTQPPAQTSAIEQIGRATVGIVRSTGDILAFIGELLSEGVKTLRHPRQLRWRDTLATIEAAGSNALPILALLGFLFGLIIAFQSAVPMKRFGVELYVANLVAIAMLRELGPILTAIILASRSGSAFAAELGTMKVREEIAALTTMGLSPVRFLALPRVLAGMFVAPLLTVFCNLVALVGAGLVILTFGYPLVTYVNQVVGAVTYVDLLSGMLKSVVFGLLIAAVGCMQGLNTGSGASAVGEATTRSVVAGLVLIIVSDGVFAAMQFSLGL
jgi:phospholipid/cholesterol/gamma-HCH transport system permease protein